MSTFGRINSFDAILIIYAGCHSSFFCFCLCYIPSQLPLDYVVNSVSSQIIVREAFPLSNSNEVDFLLLLPMILCDSGMDIDLLEFSVSNCFFRFFKAQAHMSIIATRAGFFQDQSLFQILQLWHYVPKILKH